MVTPWGWAHSCSSSWKLRVSLIQVGVGEGAGGAGPGQALAAPGSLCSPPQPPTLHLQGPPSCVPSTRAPPGWNPRAQGAPRPQRPRTEAPPRPAPPAPPSRVGAAAAVAGAVPADGLTDGAGSQSPRGAGEGPATRAWPLPLQRGRSRDRLSPRGPPGAEPPEPGPPRGVPPLPRGRAAAGLSPSARLCPARCRRGRGGGSVCACLSVCLPVSRVAGEVTTPPLCGRGWAARSKAGRARPRQT